MSKPNSHYTFPLCVAVSAVTLCMQAADPVAPAAPPANAVPAARDAEIPQSVFIIPSLSKEGRNPFFPHSAAKAVVLPVSPRFVDATLVLNGITSKPRPSVMINSRTFEKGEEGEVKLPGGGKVLVRCEEITENSATVLVNGTQRRQLHLRSVL